MKKFIFLLFFIPLGCSVESSAIEDNPTSAEDMPTVVEKNPPVIERSIVKGCSTEPLLEMYENFVELGIKSANLSTEKANIVFKKIKTPEAEVKSMLASEFGAEFLKNACAFDGLIFSIDDVRNNYVGTYQITYNSEESALLAANIIRDANSTQLKVFKVATVFNWRLINDTILINYNSPATTVYYEHNVNELSK